MKTIKRVRVRRSKVDRFERLLIGALWVSCVISALVALSGGIFHV